MKIIAQEDKVYLFSIGKKETKAIDKISQLFQCDFTYYGITDENDLRVNGYKELIERYFDRIDFRKQDLIIAKRS